MLWHIYVGNKPQNTIDNKHKGQTQKENKRYERQTETLIDDNQI